MARKRKTVFVRSVWVMLSIFFALLFAFIAVGSSIAKENSAAINSMFGISPNKKVQLAGSDADMEYYKSDYVQKNAAGAIEYVTDENGYKHQVYDDKAMRANSERVAEQTAVEGSVLLWNDNDALPLSENDGVSVFGISSNDYLYLGRGSGGMTIDPKDGSLAVALRNKGLAVNTDLNTKYLQLLEKYRRKLWNDKANTNYRCWFEVNEAPWREVSAIAETTIATYGDAAVMIVSRSAGEDYDISTNVSDTYVDGGSNYLELTREEAGILEGLNALKDARKLGKVILLLNTANPMQFQSIVKDEYGVDACVWVGMGGTMSFVQIADVLTGDEKYAVSGRATDTLVYDNHSAPSYANFGDFTWTEMSDGLPDLEKEYGEFYQTHNQKYMVYQEGIYVGYRYYETRYEDYVLGTPGAGVYDYCNTVAFPFGYGGSYADFEYSAVDFKETDDAYEVSLNIKNKSGSGHNGKDVLQVYLQKPYTPYDDANNIEKAAVELVGFAKTDLLKPGDDQTLKVTVDKENLRTYDAYGRKTYILETGDYYLSVGTDAHDALNNILAAKPLTDEQKARMTDSEGKPGATGNADFACKITIGADDYDKYSLSAETKNKITNRFDDADLNRYAGTADQKIDYVSRKDWTGTLPTGEVRLKCVDDRMVEDMRYGREVAVEEGDELPLYGTVTSPEGELNLAMLSKLEYDNPAWEDLLNQMTFAEQNRMGSYGLHYLADALSIFAPGCKAKDGPAGVKTKNPTLGNLLGFPSPVVMAQTWDTSLIKELGVAFAHEALHADLALVYAPGADIHRSAYGGRNWEYYSEDGVLSGKILSAEVTGLQSRGIIVMTKHFAFNDQERNRYGVATFFNEQSAREVYLKPFEIAVREGRMNGVMSSFNRVGCTWAGAHKGLLTDVLRGEWNFIGIVETDSCTGNTFHMGDTYAKAEGLVAGNDMWMAGGSKEYFAEHKDNATVMLALREACHRILYTQLHSAAMNGMDMNTVLQPNIPWWELLLTSLMIAVGILTLACVALAVLSFVFDSAKYKKYRSARTAARTVAAAAANVPADSGSGGGTGGGKRPSFLTPKRKKILIIAVTAVLVVAIALVGVLFPVLNCASGRHVCGNVCEICGKCLDPDCDDPACADKCEGHVVPHVCASVCPECGKCLNLDCAETVCADKCGAGLTAYTFEAEDAQYEDGIVGYNPVHPVKSGDRTYIGDLNRNTGAKVTFTVLADESVTVSLVVTVNRRIIDTVFTDKMGVSINGGKELVRPVTIPAFKDQWTDASFADFNLGCVALRAGENTIRFTVLAQGDYSSYNFDRIKLLSPAAVNAPHVCASVCPECGECMDDGCEDAACAEKCAGHELENQRIHATAAGLGSGTKGLLSPQKNGDGMIENVNQNKGASLTFAFNTQTGGKAKLVAAVTTRAADTKFTDALTVTVNGGAYPTEAVVPNKNGKVDWYVSTEVELGEIELLKGVNSVVFTVPTDRDIGFNFHYIRIVRESLGPDIPDVPVETSITLGAVTDAKRGAGVKGLPGRDKKYPVLMGGINQNKGVSLTFEFTSPSAGKAMLVAAVTRRKNEVRFTDSFTVTVNGGETFVTDAVIPATGTGSDNWADTAEVELGEIALHAGVNTVVFTLATDEEPKGVNFGYITLRSAIEISAHVCSQVCPDCGKCRDTACEDPTCAEKCADYAATKLLGTAAVLGEGGNGLPAAEPQRPGMIGGLNGNIGATLTFGFVASAGTARLCVAVTTRTTENKFTDGISFSVNGGEPLTSDAVIPATTVDNWYDTMTIDLGEITLQDGENTLVFTVVGADKGFNIRWLSVVCPKTPA